MPRSARDAQISAWTPSSENGCGVSGVVMVELRSGCEADAALNLRPDFNGGDPVAREQHRASAIVSQREHRAAAQRFPRLLQQCFSRGIHRDGDFLCRALNPDAHLHAHGRAGCFGFAGRHVVKGSRVRVERSRHLGTASIKEA